LQGPTLTGKEARRFPFFFLLHPDHIASRILRYVKSAVAETDVPEGLPEFINQRRRWLNGSFFAATYAIAHVGQMLSSGHTVSRKVVLSIQTIYNVINLIASWFSIVSIILETMLTVLSDQTKGKLLSILRDIVLIP
jgi:cellulose synthase/poly-beta-1,6-N-acetylglucosamine synthase-like glycosyltransferase